MMTKLLPSIIIFAAAAVAISANSGTAVIPAKISKDEVVGKIFERKNMIEMTHESGNVTLDVTTLLSSDKKFASGMYRSGKSYFEASDPYGVDEFMYFLEGNVKLTSSDGNNEVYAGLRTAGPRWGFGDEMIRIGAVKFVADGSASERTMYMSTPFEGTDDHGILTMTQEQIDDAVDDSVAHGFRVGIHANGDWTIDMVLNAYERVLKNHPGPNPRHRIEHCSLINDSPLNYEAAIGKSHLLLAQNVSYLCGNKLANNSVAKCPLFPKADVQKSSKSLK
jgi:uncharacterized cupin superfamily protein